MAASTKDADSDTPEAADEPKSPLIDLTQLALSCSEAITAVLKTTRKSWNNDVDHELEILLGLKDSGSRLDDFIPHLTRAKIDLRPRAEAEVQRDPMVLTIGVSLIFLATQLERLMEATADSQGNSQYPMMPVQRAPS